jgi:hypothetical protein
VAVLDADYRTVGRVAVNPDEKGGCAPRCISLCWGFTLTDNHARLVDHIVNVLRSQSDHGQLLLQPRSITFELPIA